MEAELKQKLTKAKRQLLALKAKLGEATSARDAALAQLQDQVTGVSPGQHLSWLCDVQQSQLVPVQHLHIAVGSTCTLTTASLYAA